MLEMTTDSMTEVQTQQVRQVQLDEVRDVACGQVEIGEQQVFADVSVIQTATVRLQVT